MHIVHSFTVLYFATALTFAAPLPAQRRPAGSAPQEAKVNATITLNVALTFASCGAEPAGRR